MGTLGDLKTAIASDLRRDDLGPDLASKIAEAIGTYENELFWFNFSRTVAFDTVPGQMDYGSADLAAIPRLIRVLALFLLQPPSVVPLDRDEPGEFEILAGSAGGSGRPARFTFVDGTIRLWPRPAAVYRLRAHAVVKSLPLAGDGESNAWTSEAEALIRCHAKYLLYMNVLEDEAGATRMRAQLPDILASLRAETSSRLSSGRIRPSDF